MVGGKRALIIPQRPVRFFCRVPSYIQLFSYLCNNSVQIVCTVGSYLAAGMKDNRYKA